jgi:hypothetical protein
MIFTTKIIPILILITVSITTTLAMQRLWPAADEMVFIRVVENLPSYASHAEWWTLDGKTHPSVWVNNPDTADIYDITQNMSMWSHPQLASYVAWPLVKILNIDNPTATNESITDKVNILRLAASLMLIASMTGIYYLLNKRFYNNSGILTICMMPFAAMLVFFTWQGNNWFYPDTFFTLFFVTALVMRETKYKNYIYIPLFLMVGSTIYAILFLLPFILENRKTAWCSLALIPFFVQSYIVSGNSFTPYLHFITIGTINSSIGNITNDSSFIANRFQAIIGNAKLAWELLIFALPAFVYLIYGYIKKRTNLFYILLMGFALVIGLVWWRQYYLMLPMAFLTPLLLRQAFKDKVIK